MYQKHEPSILFHMLHHAHKRQVVAEQRARGVADMGAPMLLMTLFHADCNGEKLSQRELARRLRLSPATVAVSLKTMERCGYVSREVDDRDARRNLVTITQKGREAVELCGHSFKAADEQMLSDFTPEEKEQLTGFFVRMLKNLGVTDPQREGPPFSPKRECSDCRSEDSPPRRQRRKERDSQ
ncbi:MAG: MarR family transcriptional regulator [Oscillospiraceae bacterium]|nr:MarR family transcriptional regulator [Oscillospiraceae bacterium]